MLSTWFATRRASWLSASLAIATSLSACAADESDLLEPSDDVELSESTQALGTPYDIGAGAGAGSTWERFTAASSTLYAASITPTRAVMTRELRVRAAVAGGSCRLGLYDEANARPSRLIASAASIVLQGGINRVSLGSAPQLAAGRRYWVAALCSGSAQLYRRTITGETSYAGFAFSFLPLPSAFPSSATPTSNRALGLSALVEDVGVCVPGTRQCMAASTLGICTPDGGSWSVQQCATTCQNGACVACTPSTSVCQSPSTLNVCSASGVSTLVQCSATTSCVNGACSGVCRAGALRCGGNANPEICSSTGTWVQASTCASGSVCRDGSCVANNPYALGTGASADATWLGWNPPDDQLYLVPVVPARTVSVQRLQAIGRTAAGVCQMALYGDSAGRPGTLIARGTSFPIIAGANGTPPTSAATLTASTRYWIGGVCEGAPQLLQRSSTSSYAVTPLQLGASFPVTFPASALLRSGLDLSFSLVVQDAP